MNANAQIAAPIITITGPAQVRTMTDSKGFAKQIHYQEASLEADHMRVKIDHEFDTPELALKVGDKYSWDVTADLVPGKFGRLELARRRTLRPLSEIKPVAVAKA
ncbi:hypothetical protein [Lysobacter sp. 1R34A]|uniref:hypothetical protein n=1 Tax=Lysobacter sp. 1R34A TaxID=3445786 RepID=UPI003EED7085